MLATTSSGELVFPLQSIPVEKNNKTVSLQSEILDEDITLDCLQPAYSDVNNNVGDEDDDVL